MKLAYSTLQNIIEITDDTIHSIVVENPEYYYHMRYSRQSLLRSKSRAS